SPAAWARAAAGSRTRSCEPGLPSPPRSTGRQRRPAAAPVSIPPPLGSPSLRERPCRLPEKAAVVGLRRAALHVEPGGGDRVQRRVAASGETGQQHPQPTADAADQRRPLVQQRAG